MGTALHLIIGRHFSLLSAQDKCKPTLSLEPFLPPVQVNSQSQHPPDNTLNPFLTCSSVWERMEEVLDVAAGSTDIRMQGMCVCGRCWVLDLFFIVVVVAVEWKVTHSSTLE